MANTQHVQIERTDPDGPCPCPGQASQEEVDRAAQMLDDIAKELCADFANSPSIAPRMGLMNRVIQLLHEKTKVILTFSGLDLDATDCGSPPRKRAGAPSKSSDESEVGAWRDVAAVNWLYGCDGEDQDTEDGEESDSGSPPPPSLAKARPPPPAGVRPPPAKARRTESTASESSEDNEEGAWRVGAASFQPTFRRSDADGRFISRGDRQRDLDQVARMLDEIATDMSIGSAVSFHDELDEVTVVDRMLDEVAMAIVARSTASSHDDVGKQELVDRVQNLLDEVATAINDARVSPKSALRKAPSPIPKS